VSFGRVKEILLEALPLAPPERDAYLDRACAGDPELRREVDSLLAHRDRAASILGTEGMAGQIHSLLDGENLPASGPEHIGPYRVLGVLGKGGMGVVYRAEQTAPLRREVAIKLVRTGFASEQVVARFEAERETLGLMDHPGIARVLDAGTSADGYPYFVMELVEGSPITEYAEKHRLDLDRRLELFLQVCDAVQHAHQKGIIHRDLKPSNILIREVDGRPLAKIIDFGIAKAVQGSGPGPELVTLEGQVLGTPQYMSPEQASLLPGGIDVRSDVYALGVVLYELLVDARPFDGGDRPAASFTEMRSALLERDPPPPGLRLEDRGEGAADVAERRGSSLPSLLRDLRGDLGQVVLKAMERDPARRYPGALEFANDLRRYRDQLPVEAQGPGTVYRMRKFVRRHKLPVTAAAAGLLALLLGAAGTTWQAVRATRLQHRAEVRLQDVQRFAEEVLFGLHDRIQELPGATPAREYLVKTTLEYLDELARDPADAALLREGLSSGYSQLSIVQRDLGQTDSARVSIEKSLVFARDMVDAAPWDPRARRMLARRLNTLAVVVGAQGDLNRSYQLHGEALGIFRGLAHDWPESTSVTEEICNTETRISFAAVRTGRAEEGVAHARSAVELREDLLAADPQNEKARIGLAYSTAFLGESLAELDRSEEALRAYVRSASLFEEVYGSSPGIPIQQQRMGVVLGAVAGEELELGRLSEAERDAARSLELRRARWELQPENRAASHDLARGHQLLGDIRAKAGDWNGASMSYSRAEERLRDLIAEDEENVFAKKDLVQLLQDRADVDLGRGDPRSAIARLEESLASNAPLLAMEPRNADHHEVRIHGEAMTGTAYVALTGEPGRTPAQRRTDWEEARRWFRSGLSSVGAMKDEELMTPMVEGNLPDLDSLVASCDSALATLP